ncbi:LptM family lipoprotein [Microbispora bryophytorum]|uniref:LptM family lipoprotein n=1 Tax=Microbispora bryophytorum TaxID=1460882 RepID=UPI00371EDE5D
MRKILRLVVALAVAFMLAGCVQKQVGVVGLTRSQDGGINIPVAWCGRAPHSMTMTILVDESWTRVAKFSTTRVGDGSVTLDLDSPSPDWKLISGDPRLRPGVTYYVEAYPDSGKDAIVGQLTFSLNDAVTLQPGDVYVGDKDDLYTWNEFLESANSMCA